MNKEEIIGMARQAGIDIGMWEKLSDNDDVFGYDFCGIHENLEAFAKLVVAKEQDRICRQIASLHDSIMLASHSTLTKKS